MRSAALPSAYPINPPPIVSTIQWMPTCTRLSATAPARPNHTGVGTSLSSDNSTAAQNAALE